MGNLNWWEISLWMLTEALNTKVKVNTTTYVKTETSNYED